jgi:hypothetical protein
MGIKRRINVGLVLIRIRSVLGIAYISLLLSVGFGEGYGPIDPDK